MTLKKVVAKKNLYYLTGILAISIFCLRYLANAKGIIIGGDEFGYWSTAAYTNGYDWKEIATRNDYYSYGYGFLLSPIMKIFSEPSMMYKVAIVMNVVLLCAIFFISAAVIRRLAPNLADAPRIAFALASTMVTSNLFYTQFTLSESLLAILAWLTVYFAIRIFEKPVIWNITLLVLILAYMYAVHQRTIGVVAVWSIYLLFILCSKKKWRLLAISLFIGVLLCMGLILFKYIYQDSYLSANFDSEYIKKNDYHYLTGKMQLLFSFHGFKLLAKGAAGKIFYLLSESYLLLFGGVTMFFFALKESLKLKKLSLRTVISFFSIASIVSMSCISSVFHIRYDERIDLLTHGRYMEFILGPALAMGLIFLYENRQIIAGKYACGVVLIYSFIALCINKITPFGASNAPLFISSPFFSPVYYGSSVNGQFILIIALRVIVIFGIMVLLFYFSDRKSIFLYLAILLLIGNWVNIYQYNYEKQVLNWAGDWNEKYDVIKLDLENIEYSGLCCYVGNDSFGFPFQPLQFQMYDEAFSVIRDIEQVKELKQNTLLLVESSPSEQNSYLKQNNYVLIHQKDNLAIWAHSSHESALAYRDSMTDNR